MHMYCTAKVDTAEYFRAESSHFMSVMMGTLAEKIGKRSEQCKIGKYLILLTIYRRMYDIIYYSPNPENVFSMALLTIEWSLMDRGNSYVVSQMSHIN